MKHLFLIDLTIEAKDLKDAESKLKERLRGTNILRGNYCGTVNEPSPVVIPKNS